MMQYNAIRTGKMLLAEPFMVDSNFRRSAVVLCEHGSDGTVGFIMNKPLNTRIDLMIEDFPEFSANVYFGGPVSTDTIHYIHNVGDLLEESIPVTDGIYWSGNFDKLKFLIDSKLITPDNIRFFRGYSGWDAKQLETEMEAGSWVVADMYANYLFKTKSDTLWQDAMQRIGNNYQVIAQVPDSHSWN